MIGGASAARYLYDQVDKKTGKHYLGIYTNGPDGRSLAFERINGLTNGLSQIVNSPQVGQLDFKTSGSKVTDDRTGEEVTIGKLDLSKGFEPGAVTYSNADYKFHFNVLDGGPYGELPRDMMSDGQPGVLTQDILVGHEAVGHGFYPADQFSNSRAVNFENQVRQLKDPGAPYRKYHDESVVLPQ